jgi:hypothetical protein
MPSAHKIFGFLLGLFIFFSAWNPGYAQATNPIKNFNSPIVKLEPEKGFFLITTESGILWVQVEDTVKEHLKTLEVGDVIEVVVEVRPDNVPPILKSWKLSRSASSCKVFDGKACIKG